MNCRCLELRAWGLGAWWSLKTFLCFIFFLLVPLISLLKKNTRVYLFIMWSAGHEYAKVWIWKPDNHFQGVDSCLSIIWAGETELKWSGSVTSAIDHWTLFLALYFLSFPFFHSSSYGGNPPILALAQPLPPHPVPFLVLSFFSTLYPFSKEMAPAIDWLSCLQAIFTPMSLSPAQTLVVRDLDYLRNMSQLVEEELLANRFAQVELDRYWAWKESEDT